MRLTRYFISWICLVLLSTGSAAEPGSPGAVPAAEAAPKDLPQTDPCDPWASLNPRHAIVCLAALREPLDKAPEDQHLLGLAIMAYANLSLGGSINEHGACGPWFSYAQELIARRSQLRGDQPPITLAEAEPELWFRFMRADMRSIEEALARYPDEKDTPRARALHAAATGDWRDLDQRKPLTPHERYALIWAARRCYRPESRERVNYRDPKLNIDATVVLFSSPYWKEMPYKIQYVNQVVADAVWMLASQKIADADANRHLDDMRQALEMPELPGLSRAERIQAIGKVILTGDRPYIPPKAYAIAVRIAESLRGPRPGLLVNGKHQLASLGDVAHWMAGRLYKAGPAAYDGNTSGHHEPGRPLTTHLKQEAPHALVTSLLDNCGSYDIIMGNDPRGWPNIAHSFQSAIAQESLREFPLNDLLLLEGAALLHNDHQDATKRALAWLERMGTSQDIDLRGFWFFIESIQTPRYSADWWKALRRMAQADPWMWQTYRYTRLLPPDKRLFDTSGKAAGAVWRDTVIDKKMDQWKELPPSHHLLVRWQGMLDIRQAGAHAFQISFRNISMLRLQVGDQAMTGTNWRNENRMKSTMMHLDLPTGRHPVVLEIVVMQGRPSCQLEWKPPGANILEPMPAEVITDGSGHAGWSAQAWAGPIIWKKALQLPDDERRFLESCAWNSRLMLQVAEWRAWIGFADEGLEWLEHAKKASPRGYENWDEEKDIEMICHNEATVLACMKRCSAHGKPLASGLQSFIASRQELRDFIKNNSEVLLQALEKRGDHAQVARCRGFLELMSGDFAKAYEDLNSVINEVNAWPDTDERYIARLEVAALGRLLGKPEADWEALRRDAKPPWIWAIEAIAGRMSLEEAREIAANKDTDKVVIYALGLAALIHGDHADVMPLLAPAADTDASHMSAVASAECLRNWIAIQKPDTLSALPRAKRTATVDGGNKF